METRAAGVTVSVVLPLMAPSVAVMVVGPVPAVLARPLEPAALLIVATEVIEEARRCAETGEPKVILTALCGHGHFDMAAYERYLSGEMTDFDLSQERIDAALRNLPGVPGA